MLKKISLFLVIVLSLSILTSCRIKGTDTGTTSLSGVILNYYKMNDARDVMEPLIAEYVQNKKGLTINYRVFDDYEEYERVILNEMAEGGGPDIFSMPNSWFASNYKKISPMPEAYGTLNDFDTLFVDVASKDLIQVDTDGIEKIYGIPMTIDTLALYYNKSHFEDRIPSQGKPSSTWEGLMEDVTMLNQYDYEQDSFDVSGLALGVASNVNYSVDVLYALLLQFQPGVDLYDDLMTHFNFSSSKISSSGKSLLDILKLYSSFADFSQKNYSWNMGMADSSSKLKEIESFVNGKVSMIFGYSSNYEIILSEINKSKNTNYSVISKDDVKIAPFPQILDSSGAVDKRVAYASYYAETVSRNTENADIAWDFLVFITQKNNLQNYFDNTKKPTSRRDMIEEQTKNPIYGIFASQIGYAKSFPIVDLLKYESVFIKMLDFISEGGDVTKAYKDAETEINKLLPIKGFRNLKVE